MINVVFTAFDGVQPLDVIGPHEVFAAANAILHAAGGQSAYQCEIRASTRTITGYSGVALQTKQIRDPLDGGTLVIPGGAGSIRFSDSRLRSWLARARPDRLLTVCTGAYIAAEAGLIDHHRVTTHWAYADELHKRFPSLKVDANPVWTRDGDVWSSGGVTAGIDLALAVVAEDLGSDLAQAVARELVMHVRRPGNQSQFAAPVWQIRAKDARIRELEHWLVGDPARSRTPINELADRARLSERHFQRVFRRETGIPIGQYLQSLRLTNAQERLCHTDEPIKLIARKAGYGSTETMRREFIERLGISPTAYRANFT